MINATASASWISLSLVIGLALGTSSARLDLQSLATDITMRVLDTPLPRRSALPARAPREDLRRRAARAFRSEAILAAAARLFQERGFNGVSLSDIGAASCGVRVLAR